jgi:hypothetical protein
MLARATIPDVVESTGMRKEVEKVRGAVSLKSHQFEHERTLRYNSPQRYSSTHIEFMTVG